MRILGYARVSSREQANDSHALEQQVERLKAAGATEIYTDVESGYKGRKRPQLEKILELVRARQCDQVVVTRLDRISRKGVQSFAVFEDFIQAEISLRALDEVFDLSTPSGKMTAGLLAVIAQHHSDQKAEAVSHGWQHLRNRQVAMQPPFGYCKIDNRHHLDHTPFCCLLTTKEEKTKAKIAREMVDAFFDRRTLRLALRTINERYGIMTTDHGKGRHSQGLFRFSPGGFRSWLINPVLRGHLCYLRKKSGKQRKPKDWDIRFDTHPTHALITPAEFQEIEAILAHNAQFRGYGSTAQKYPLSGLIFCGECGSACYSLKSGRGKTPGYNYYFQCKNWRTRGCSQKKTIQMSVVESAVVDALIQRREMIASLTQAPDKIIDPPELKEMRAASLALESILGFDPDIEEARIKLRNRIDNYARLLQSVQLDQESANCDILLNTFAQADYWHTLLEDEKRVIYRALVQQVVIRDGQVFGVALKI